MNDFYYILGLDAGCTFGEVQDAYRKLSKKFHPDLNQGDKYFEGRFREIKEAYDTLSDPHKRSAYDLKLKQFESNNANQGINKQAYQTTASAVTPPRRGPGVGMTIALIVLALILGDYIIKYLINSKKAAVSTVYASTADTVSHIVPKKHKRKHHIKDKAPEISINDSKVVNANIPVKHTSNKSAQAKPVLVKIAAAKPAAVKAPTVVKPTIAKASTIVIAPSVKQVVVKVPAAKPDPDDDNNTSGQTDKGYLYASYVKANQTGVVNMRDQDSYSANIIETIPANSRVFVLARDNTYYKVLYNNYTGYIPRWSLQTR